MFNLRQGSIHLFRVAGIDVFLHWWWFLIAIYEIETGTGRYSSPVWNVLEYLALFLIVLLHEFGHALACRQVGGTANRIMLWPLGGVAYVDPPQRPGAMLWSIAAGPLVNVALLPILMVLSSMSRSLGWQQSLPDVYIFIRAVLFIDAMLLVFNILPVYPLDGGQILRSLLWFPLGRGRSLAAATVIGFIGIAGFIAFAAWAHSIWLIVMAVYLIMNCWTGLKAARIYLRQEKLPRREGFACPSCHSAPPLGPLWTCSQCRQPFDTFESGAVCPNCRTRFPTTTCLFCRRQSPIGDWAVRTGANYGALNGEVLNGGETVL